MFYQLWIGSKSCVKLLHFLLWDLSVVCFLYLLGKIVNFVSTLYMFLQWFVSMRETKGLFMIFGADPPYFFKNLLCEVPFTLKLMIYCWEKGNVTGLTLHCFAKKNPTNLSSAWNFSVSMQESAPGAAWAFSRREMHSSGLITERQHTCVFSLQPLLRMLKNRVLFLASLLLIHQLYSY